MIPRKFPYPHPVFGSAPNRTRADIERSPYYWWWEHLRRSDEYRKAILGRQRGKVKSVVEDFGDVFSVDFKTWWRSDQRGANLFANPLVRPSVDLYSPRVDDLEQGSRLLLSVDLSIPMADLKKRFHDVLRQHHSGTRGKQASRTTAARYRLSGPPHIEAWRIGLQIYDIRQENPGLKLWEIARLVPRIWNSHAFDPCLPSRQILDEKNRVQVLVSRHLTRTQRSIGNTARGVFP
jgi:hypothetical protein